VSKTSSQAGDTIPAQKHKAVRAPPPDVAPTNRAAADLAFSEVLRLVRTVQTGMQNIDSGHGLSGSQLWALWQISAQSGRRVSELAEALHIHASTASNLLDKLEVRGLVRRERRDQDNRVVRLYLSDAGAELVKQIPGPMQGKLRGALQKVPRPVLDGLLEGVISLLGIMEATAAREPNRQI